MGARTTKTKRIIRSAFEITGMSLMYLLVAIAAALYVLITVMVSLNVHWVVGAVFVAAVALPALYDWANPC